MSTALARRVRTVSPGVDAVSLALQVWHQQQVVLKVTKYKCELACSWHAAEAGWGHI